MKIGSLIVFEEEAQGYDLVQKQGNLFRNDLIRINTGTCGIVCKLYDYPSTNMTLAEILIGNKLVCDVNLNKHEYKLIN